MSCQMTELLWTASEDQTLGRSGGLAEQKQSSSCSFGLMTGKAHWNMGGGHAMKQAGVGLSKFLSYRMGKQGQVYKYDMSTYGDPT